MALGSPLAADVFNLKGRVALITGASSGLGERFAEVASANGASVVLTARREDRMQEIVARIEKAGGKVEIRLQDEDGYRWTGNVDFSDAVVDASMSD